MRLDSLTNLFVDHESQNQDNLNKGEIENINIKILKNVTRR